MKIIIMSGLPASGKSTRAKELIEAYGNYVRVNRDLLRKMLHFGKWSGKNEGITVDAEKAVIKGLLAKKVNVIIDDTNLGKTLEMWKTLATELDVKVEVINMDTSWEECIVRDTLRPDGVGKHVIIGMARKFRMGGYRFDQDEVISDIDGTLADLTHRLSFVKTTPKDWKSFFASVSQDKPRQDIITMLEGYRELGNRIILVSGRPERTREDTEKWLLLNGVTYHVLFMRKNDDKRPDDEVKRDILHDYFDKDRVKLVIDDRPRVIRMWQAEGLEVVDVGGGIDF